LSPTRELTTCRRILLIRLSSLGDILLTTPILRLLREHCPQAKIDFLVKAAYQDLLRAHPCINRLILFNAQQSLWHTLRRLRQTRYDVVLDLHRTLRSRMICQGLSAPLTLAYHKRVLRRQLLVRLGWNTLGDMTPVPELYAAPLRRLGIDTELSAPTMQLEPGSRDAMRQHLAQAFPAVAGRPLLALAPGARWATKRWPVERFATVAQTLGKRYRAGIVILGDNGDTGLAQALCQRLDVPVFNASGKLSLMQTAALLQQCRLLISNDSGLMHMATALNIPVVAVFGPTVEEFGFYPFRAQARVISTRLACRPCSTKGSRHCPKGHHQCMLNVGTDQVLTAAQQMWETETHPDDPFTF
jgi:lipopolysaccharide heptosyltransferase II